MTVIWALGSNRAKRDCLFTVPVDHQSGPGGLFPEVRKSPGSWRFPRIGPRGGCSPGGWGSGKRGLRAAGWQEGGWQKGAVAGRMPVSGRGVGGWLSRD